MIRKNLYYLVFLFLAVAFITSCQSDASNKSVDEAFAHHVYFWLENPDDPDDRAEFEKGVRELLEVPVIQSYHFGTPAATTDRDVVEGSYTYSYLVFFEDRESHDVYQEHPIHQQFIKDYQHLWKKVVVYDAVMEE
jgi:hypothetical protein